MAGSVKKRVTVTASGKRVTTWRARYPDPLRGETAQIERTFKGDGAAKRAEAWRRTMDESAYNGTYVNPNEARTLAVVADEYRQTWTNLEPRTKQAYEQILKTHVLPRFGKAKINAI